MVWPCGIHSSSACGPTGSGALATTVGLQKLADIIQVGACFELLGPLSKWKSQGIRVWTKAPTPHSCWQMPKLISSQPKPLSL